MGAVKEHYHDEIEAGMHEQNEPQVKNKHKIQWLNLPGYKGESWNPVIGCSKVSEGCENCYALRMAIRIAGMERKTGRINYRAALMPDANNKQNEWNGLTFLADDEKVLQPLIWKQPRVVFVCSMGDLFHESVPFEWVDKVMAIAALLPKHIFIVLTKRAKRMAEYFEEGKEKLVKRWENAIYEMGIADKNEDPDAAACFLYNRCLSGAKVADWGWPLSNVWVGVTAENQTRANERVPYLLQMPAAVRFVSVEPMLGPVNLMRIPAKYWGKEYKSSEYNGIELSALIGGSNTPEPWHLNWVICGGESGHKARPMNPDWVRNLKNQCRAAGVPFFFKQWGEWSTDYPNGKNLRYIRQTYQEGTSFYKVGKKAAGNLLDGKQWEEYPEEV